MIKDAGLDIKQFEPKTFKNHISQLKNTLISPEQAESMADDFLSKKVANIYKIYQNQLFNSAALDFDDLLIKPLELFKKFPEILEKYQTKYSYVLVDEYQDTNKPQFNLLEGDLIYIPAGSFLFGTNKKDCRSREKIIISTGMSTLDEVDAAVETIKTTNANASYAVLHCNSTYPAPTNELNLNIIPKMKDRYGCMIGYSGHEYDLEPTALAVALGAKIIERHITLDRTMYGSDQASSLEPSGLNRLVRDLRMVDNVLGDGKKRIWESEIPAMKKLREILA